MTVITRANLRHAAAMVRFGRRPAATVYDSIGPSFFLALDDGWLNLGLWEGDGSDPSEAPAAVRRLVRTIAAPIPPGADVLDVGNGLAAQDVELAAAIAPRSLTAVNITLLAARGRARPARRRRRGRRERRRLQASAPCPLGRRGDQRRGRIPFPVSRPVLRRGVPGAATGRRADVQRRAHPALPGIPAGGGGRCRDAPPVGDPPVGRRHTRSDRGRRAGGRVRRRRAATWSATGSSRRRSATCGSALAAGEGDAVQRAAARAMLGEAADAVGSRRCSTTSSSRARKPV